MTRQESKAAKNENVCSGVRSGPGNGERKMPHARRCQYRTSHRGRAGAVVACEVETRAYSGEALAEQMRVRELLSQSREHLKHMQAS
jgi:hypothetical protein